MSKQPKIIAQDIERLLEQKHSNDVFVLECKNGPSQMGNGHLRMDAWVMNRSWANACVTGYEIKVSRQDFLKDEKWHGYLDYCNQFYFVCPSGIIQPDELPEGVGLLWVSKTGTRLFSKKKAVHRRGPIPEELFRYILMSRASIKPGGMFVKDETNSDQEYWRRWLEKRETDREFGRRVSYKIREVVENRIREVERENERLKSLHERYDKMRQWLIDLGEEPDRPPVTENQLRRNIEAVKSAIPPGMAIHLRNLVEQAERLKGDLEKIEGGDHG